MARVVFSPSAREDLQHIRDYIARDSPGAAKATAQRIQTQARRLARFPQLGRAVPEYADPAVRALIVAPYRVLYRYGADDDRVHIIAIVHGSRRLPSQPDDG